MKCPDCKQTLSTGDYGAYCGNPDCPEFDVDLLMYDSRLGKCPLGGDEADDCLGCIYSGDYHFINGKCERR